MVWLPLLRGVADSAARRATRRPRGRHFDADGVPVYYCDEGSGPVVVLVHGFAVTGNVNFRWPGITEALARDFRVLSLDLRGHGRSGKPHDPRHYGEEIVRDVVRLLDHLGIERAHVVGYSLGGFVTLRLAASHPERLARVAIAGAGWEPPNNSEFVATLVRVAEELRQGRAVDPLVDGFPNELPAPGPAQRAWLWANARLFNDHRALAAMLTTVPSFAVSEDELRAIELPICSIVGTRDPLIRSVRAMQGKVADHQVTFIEGADHLGAAAHPELLDVLRQFLAAD
jgi:pimeloyl-ACP methyl ester carboxylesterase